MRKSLPILNFPLKVVLVCTGIASILHLGGLWWWLFDLVSNFRAQLGLVSFFLVLTVIAARLWRWLALALLILLINTAFLIPLYLSPRPTKSETNFKIVFANLNINNDQTEKVISFLSETNPDVIVLAEISSAMYQDLTTALPQYTAAQRQTGKGVFGIAILSKLETNQEIVVHDFGQSGLPSLELHAQTSTGPVTILATHPYPPMSGSWTQLRNQQLLALSAHAGKITQPVIMIGDFNTTPYSPLFNKIKTLSNTKDTRPGFGIQASWRTTFPFWMRIPIDHAFVSPEISVTNRQLGPDIGSDHLPLIVELAIPDSAPLAEQR